METKTTEMVSLKLPHSTVSVQIEASKSDDISHIEARWWAASKILKRTKDVVKELSGNYDEFEDAHSSMINAAMVEQCWRYHLNSMIEAALFEMMYAKEEPVGPIKVTINGRDFYYELRKGKRYSFVCILWPNADVVEVSL